MKTSKSAAQSPMANSSEQEATAGPSRATATPQAEATTGPSWADEAPQADEMDTSRPPSQASMTSQASGATSITGLVQKMDIAGLNRDQRRFIEHLKSKFNVTDEAALEASMKRKRPSRSARAAKKRNGSPSRPSPGNPAYEPPKKRPNLTTSEVVLCRRVGIIGDGAFTEEQMESIKDGIMQVVKSRPNTCPPEFRGIQNRYGFVVAIAADPESVTWLHQQQGAIAAVCGFPLRVVEGDDIPKTALYKCAFSASKRFTNEDILDTLGSQARGIDLPTDEWKVVRRIENGEDVVLFLSVDITSADVIRQNNGSLVYRFGRVKLYPTTIEAGESEPGPGVEPTPEEATSKLVKPPALTARGSAPNKPNTRPTKPTSGRATPPAIKQAAKKPPQATPKPPGQETIPGMLLRERAAASKPKNQDGK